MAHDYRRKSGQGVLLGLVLLTALILCGCGGCGGQTAAKSSSQQPDSMKAARPPAPAAVAATPPSQVGDCQQLSGKTAWSQRDSAAWIDLPAPMDFRRGDRVQINVAGSARRFLIRFLPQGESYGASAGIENGAIPMPANGITTVVVRQDHLGTKQISVHSGPNPWGIHPLGPGDGLITLSSACVTHSSPAHQ